jgi:hypothetical protein
MRLSEPLPTRLAATFDRRGQLFSILYAAGEKDQGRSERRKAKG